MKTFHRQAAYIMQDHELQPYITVMEAMHFSANLKIGGEMSATQKKIRVSTDRNRNRSTLRDSNYELNYITECSVRQCRLGGRVD